jgi:hypothetical protein
MSRKTMRGSTSEQVDVGSTVGRLEQEERSRVWQPESSTEWI